MTAKRMQYDGTNGPKIALELGKMANGESYVFGPATEAVSAAEEAAANGTPKDWDIGDIGPLTQVNEGEPLFVRTPRDVEEPLVANPGDFIVVEDEDHYATVESA